MFDRAGDIRLTVDLVITAEKGRYIVLITRRYEPFFGRLVLPGGYFDNSDIDVKSACARQGKKIGIILQPSFLTFLTELDCVTRDPRPGDRRISLAYTIDYADVETLRNAIKPPNKIEQVHIKSISSLRENDLGFDHWRAILAIKSKYR